MGKDAIVEDIVNWTLFITLIPMFILIFMGEYPVAIQSSQVRTKMKEGE